MTEAEYNYIHSTNTRRYLIYKLIFDLFRDLTTASGSTSVNLTSQQSGGSIGIIYVALVDQFGQVVSSDSSSTATLSIVGTYSDKTYIPTLTGTTTLTASRGTFAFKDITFTAEPGALYSKCYWIIIVGLSLSTTGIDTNKPSNQEYMRTHSLDKPEMSFAVALRTCEPGESFSTIGACVKCIKDIEYSLKQQSEPGSCKPCRNGRMFWYGGSDIGPKPGYWRSSNTSDNFIAWLNEDACLGYKSEYNNSLGACKEGYQGILCADWKVGYSRKNEHECAKCPSIAWNIAQLVMIYVFKLGLLIYTIRSTLASALELKNNQSVYIKIMINHLQLLALTASFNFEWPSSILALVGIGGIVTNSSSNLVSLDCFLDSRDDNDDQNNIRLYYQNMIMFTIIPLVMTFCSIIFWSLYFCRKTAEEKLKKKSRIYASVIILLFGIHPAIVEYMFSNFR